MTDTAEATTHFTMEEVLSRYPGARRTLFQLHHIGGCSSCGFGLNETLEELAERSHSSKSDILRKAIALFDVAAQAKQKDQRVGILDRDDKVVKEIVGI